MSQAYKVAKPFHDRQQLFKPFQVGDAYDSSDRKRINNLLMLGYIEKMEKEVTEDGEKD